MKLSPLAIATFCALPHMAMANTVQDEETLDEIQVTGSRRQELSSAVPQAINVLSAEELRTRASAQTNADLLHGEVGTFVQQTTPGQGVVIIRGLKGSEVLHLVDGFRLNNAFFRNAPNQYPALVDPLMIEQIEVARGPSSVLYGSDAMGGVVHMISTRAPFAETDTIEHHGRFRNRFASADHSTVTRGEYAVSSERVAFGVGLTYQDVNELTIGNDVSLPFTAYSARFGNADLGFKIADGHELRFSAQYARQPKTPRFDELVPGFGQTTPTSAEFLFKPQERRFAQLVYRFDAGNDWFDRAELHVGRQDIIDDRLNRDFGTLNRDTEQNRSELKGITVQFEKSLGGHYLSFGAEQYRDTVRSARQRLNISTNAQSLRASRYPDRSSMNSTGIYLTDDWQINEYFDLNGGLRYSKFDIELPSIANTPGVKLGPSKTTGNLGLAFKASEQLRIVTNIGQAFRAPNVFDLGTFGARPGNRFNIPNAQLQPESVRSIDLGMKFASEQLRAEIMVFRANYQDKITSIETGERTSANQIIVQNRNATELKLSGIEAGAELSVGEQWHSYFTATYTRGTEKLASNEFDGERIPPLFGKAGIRYEMNDQLSMEGYGFYASRQDRLNPRDRTDPRINPQGTAGWATLNAAINIDINDQLGMRAAVENIADRRYREHGTGLDEPGRNFVFSVDYGF